MDSAKAGPDVKLLHIGDLHIGKRVHERSMIDEQRYVFAQLISLAKDKAVDGVLVAGDVFDKTTPSREALELSEELFAGFLASGIPVFVIPGNHDSAQQVSYCSSITAFAGLHVAKAFSGPLERVRLEDAFGPVDIHLLPFVRPTDVRMAYPARADEVKSHDDAVRIALEEDAAAAPLDSDARHVLVAHQFVVNGGVLPETCESETPSVGGIDAVQVSDFAAFDYVALGHLHGRQSVGRPEVRYCGSPVKYSFSEARQTKCATLVELGASDDLRAVSIEEFPLRPLHEMREIEGSFEEVMASSIEEDCEDYLRIRLTDRSVYDAFNRLRAVFPNLLRLDWAEFDSADGSSKAQSSLEAAKAKDPLELFEEFLEEQRGTGLDDGEKACLVEILAEGVGDGADASLPGDSAEPTANAAGYSVSPVVGESEAAL